MDFWFSENHSKNVKYSVKVDRHLFSKTSEFQRIDIFRSEELGNILVLDGYIMVTEKDEFVYHEMITHPAFAVNPDIKNILVIGAGDGGTIRELVKYESVSNIDMVEIDKEVVDACVVYLPQTAGKLNDPRVNIYYEDGLRFVRTKKNLYDLIVVDSTDPFGTGEGLFTREFYGNCFNALTDNGILLNQHESPFFENDAKAATRISRLMRKVFPIASVYQAHIPTYPSGHWLFGFASKKLHPISDMDEKKAGLWNNLALKLKYYNTELHKGAFALPNYVKELLEDDDI